MLVVVVVTPLSVAWTWYRKLWVFKLVPSLMMLLTLEADGAFIALLLVLQIFNIGSVRKLEVVVEVEAESLSSSSSLFSFLFCISCFDSDFWSQSLHFKPSLLSFSNKASFHYVFSSLLLLFSQHSLFTCTTDLQLIPSNSNQEWRFDF